MIVLLEGKDSYEVGDPKFEGFKKEKLPAYPSSKLHHFSLY
jgi:hypothetical protein